MQNSYMYFSLMGLGASGVSDCYQQRIVAREIYDREKEDRRLYETASRAEVLERTACESRPSSAACTV